MAAMPPPMATIAMTSSTAVALDELPPSSLTARAVVDVDDRVVDVDDVEEVELDEVEVDVDADDVVVAAVLDVVVARVVVVVACVVVVVDLGTTLTTPTIDEWIRQWYVYPPGVVNAVEKISPGSMQFCCASTEQVGLESNSPAWSEVTECGASPMLVQITDSPASIVTVPASIPAPRSAASTAGRWCAATVRSVTMPHLTGPMRSLISSPARAVSPGPTSTS